MTAALSTLRPLTPAQRTRKLEAASIALGKAQALLDEVFWDDMNTLADNSPARQDRMTAVAQAATKSEQARGLVDDLR